MQAQGQPNVIGNSSGNTGALYNQPEESKGPVTPVRRGRKVTPRRVPNDDLSGSKSPKKRGKSSVKTRQANAAAGRLQQMTLN